MSRSPKDVLALQFFDNIAVWLFDCYQVPSSTPLPFCVLLGNGKSNFRYANVAVCTIKKLDFRRFFEGPSGAAWDVEKFITWTSRVSLITFPRNWSSITSSMTFYKIELIPLWVLWYDVWSMWCSDSLKSVVGSSATTCFTVASTSSPIGHSSGSTSTFILRSSIAFSSYAWGILTISLGGGWLVRRWKKCSFQIVHHR